MSGRTIDMTGIFTGLFIYDCYNCRVVTMEQDVGISEFMAEHGNYFVNWVHFEDSDMGCCPYLGPSFLNPVATEGSAKP